MTPEAEKLLMDYIRDQRTADIAGALRKIFDQFHEHESKDEVRHVEVLGELRGHSLRIGALERESNKLEDKLDQSGSWQLADLQERSKHTSRFIVNMLVMVGIALASGAISVVVTLLLKR